MTQEEKAKAYDEAYKRVAIRFGSNVADELFPELKESEDEKIRKELITHCRNTRYVTEEGAKKIAKWIAWLEKQGEQKPAWSEEDEERFESCLNILQAKGIMGVTDTINSKWLKSLKQRIQH